MIKYRPKQLDEAVIFKQRLGKVSPEDERRPGSGTTPRESPLSPSKRAAKLKQDRAHLKIKKKFDPANPSATRMKGVAPTAKYGGHSAPESSGKSPAQHRKEIAHQKTIRGSEKGKGKIAQLWAKSKAHVSGRGAGSAKEWGEFEAKHGARDGGKTKKDTRVFKSAQKLRKLRGKKPLKSPAEHAAERKVKDVSKSVGKTAGKFRAWAGEKGHAVKAGFKAVPHKKWIAGGALAAAGVTAIALAARRRRKKRREKEKASAKSSS